MRSANFGSLTGPVGLGPKMGMGTRIGLPRMKTGKGLGVPSMGGLGILKFASGGYLDSMTKISRDDAMLGMPRHTIPDYLMARLAGGGQADEYGLTGPSDPFDYPRRALTRQVDDLDLARMELSQRPVRPGPRSEMFRPGEAQQAYGVPPQPVSQRYLNPYHKKRADQELEKLRASQEEDDEGFSMDPSDIALGISGARGAAGLVLPGPLMGGLGAMLYSGDAGAPSMRKDQLGPTFDPRVAEYLAAHPEVRYGPLGARLRRMLAGNPRTQVYRGD